MLLGRKWKWFFLALPALLALPLPALAQFDHTRDAVNVRAGPDSAFPIVTWLPANTRLAIVGCTADGHWCDIAHGRRRGFVNARYLTPQFANRPAPTITFNVKDYWDAHYTRQSWFPTYVDWVDFGKPGFVPPPPPGSRTTRRPA